MRHISAESVISAVAQRRLTLADRRKTRRAIGPHLSRAHSWPSVLRTTDAPPATIAPQNAALATFTANTTSWCARNAAIDEVKPWLSVLEFLPAIDGNTLHCTPRHVCVPPVASARQYTVTE